MRGSFAVAMSWCQVSLLQLRIKLHVPNSAVCRGTSGDVVQNIERAEGLTFTIRPATRHMSAFVRMYGPIYDTVLFQHVEGTCGPPRLWTALYWDDGPGHYTVRFYTVFQISSPEPSLYSHDFPGALDLLNPVSSPVD